MSRTDAESILQKKKNWLRNKVGEIQTSYNDTLGAIREKLDGIVAEPVNAANNLLGRPDNAVSLLEIATVGNMLQESNKSLFDILLAVCPSGDNLLDGNQHVNMPMHLVPIVNQPVVSQQMEKQIVAMPASQNHSLFLIPGNGACSTPKGSELQEMEDKYGEDRRKSEASVFERNSSKQVDNSFSSDEVDPNSFLAFVSDIVSPARFSIQLEEYMPTIKRLQKELNQFYTDQNNELMELRLKNIPQPGDCCAAIFQPDNSWYRACVLLLMSPTMLVEYIDYGNVDEVPWKSAFRLHSLFTDLPRQAMHCSLSGVKPATPKYGATDGEVEWDVKAIEWFEKSVFGRIHEVVPVETIAEVTSVKLLYVEDTEGDRPVIKNVADMMVQSGLAVFDNQSDDQTPILKLCEEELNETRKQSCQKSTNGTPTCSREVITQEKESCVQESTRQKPPCTGHSVDDIAVPNLSQAKKMPAPCVNDCLQDVSNQSRSVSCIPTGMERFEHILQIRPNTRASATEEKLSGNTGNSNVTVSEHQMENLGGENKEKSFSEGNSPSPRELDDERNIDEEKILSEWNPMTEDFNSPRNSYGVDDENACVMTEGYEPENINICRHYIRGRCWNGDRCPNLHPQRTQNGDFKNEVPTFAASALTNLELMEGAWSIGRVTTVNSNGSFYVHVVKAVTDMCTKFFSRTSSLPEISPDLTNLMSDIAEHYSRDTRRLKDLIKPVPGEMYVVHVPEEKCFYRGMILDVFVSAVSRTTVKVHLVDFGRDVVVFETYLHPMCPAFMHLPKQAVMCSLWDGKLSDFPKLERIATSQNAPHLAMKVQSRNDKTDGPLDVTLYMIDKDGFHRILD